MRGLNVSLMLTQEARVWVVADLTQGAFIQNCKRNGFFIYRYKFLRRKTKRLLSLFFAYERVEHFFNSRWKSPENGSNSSIFDELR